MSFNIYEEPAATMRFSKAAREDGGEREERVIEIYESAGAVSEPSRGAQQRRPAGRGEPFRAVSLVLALLCLLLAAAVVALSRLNVAVTLEKEELIDRFQKLLEGADQLHRGNQSEGGSGWRTFPCSLYFKSTEKKNWTDSRTDCQRRAAQLVMIDSKEEQDFVSGLTGAGESWVGLQVEKTNNYDQTFSWRMVDGSTPTFLGLATGVKVSDGSTGYIDGDGKVKLATSGSKHWICEKMWP